MPEAVEGHRGTAHLPRGARRGGPRAPSGSARVSTAGEAGFSFRWEGGGGLTEPSGRTPPSPKKGSVDRTPKILPSLTPRHWR